MQDTVFFIPESSLPAEDKEYYVQRYPNIRFVTINPVSPFIELKENLQHNVRIAAGRGNTVVAIKKAFPSFHTAEIPITAYDVVRSFDMAACQGRTVAVVTNNASVIGLDMFAPLLGVRLLPYLFTPLDRLPEVIRKAKEEGADVIIGGAITCNIARELHIPAYTIQLGPESMQQTIAEVGRLRDNIKVEIARQGFISQLMDNIAAGVVSVDPHNRITELNSVMERFLRCDKSEFLGKDILDLIPDLVSHEAHGELEIPSSINDVPVLLNRTPILHQGFAYGSVITVHERKRVERMETVLRREALTKPYVARYRFNDIVGKSPALRRAVTDGRSFSRTDASIMVTGESGTGKEVFAQSIHNESARRNEPFVAVNCAALPSDLLQSELFGYVEGAFTSAHKHGKAGLFEAGHRGTIFLDEISEMALAQQGALLRVIQERYIVRLGSNTPIPVDVRIIAATNKNLKREVEEGRFREDLYYRLNVLNLDIPALRSRKEDIPALFRYFLSMHHSPFHAPFTVEEAAMAALKQYDWPGNVRELRNICERVVATAHSPTITRESVRRALFPQGNVKTIRTAGNPLSVARTNRQKRQVADILKALDESGGNMSAAASLLAIDRSTLWRRMKRNGLL